MRLFGTNGIREVVGEQFTADFVTRVADAIGALLPVGSNVVLGWDGRTSSPAFSHIVESSLVLAGHRVTEVGVLPTPAVQYNVTELGGDLGVVITASHNPPEFNGLKCIANDGLEVPREFEEQIEAGVERSARAPVAFDRVGEVVHDTGGVRRYLDGIRAQVDVPRITRRRFSIVLDCGNGASVPTSPALVRSLGCRVMTLNAHVDGTFPGHLSEPTQANLIDLQKTVPASGAEFGVAHDGDADRAVFVDASGRYIRGEEMLTLLARDAVERNPGSTVVIPVSASQSVEDAIRPFGGKVVYTRIGSPVVTREMKARNAVFGGEDNGGHVFPALQYARDGAMTLAAVLDLLTRRETDLASLLQELPRYSVVKEKVGCPVALREKVIGRLVERFSKDSEKVVTLDGVKAYRPGGWLLLRPSGTEPLFRVYAESKDPSRARALADEGLDAVRAVLQELGERADDSPETLDRPSSPNVGTDEK
jgi:phosphomannomutase/phosphoglucomutase